MQMQSPVHTPAPWVDDPHYIDGNLMPINTREKGWTKIRGSNGECVVGDIDVSTPEGEANLRLILAAPDLLAACQAFLEADNQCGANLAFVMSQEAAKKAGATQRKTAAKRAT